MRYHSTRNKNEYVTSSKAILTGIAADGGLYVPEAIPQIKLEYIISLDYENMANEILKLYLTDYSYESIKKCVNLAYSNNFDDKRIAPLVKKGENYFLELFHGKTIAFKDMALSLLPHIMTEAASINSCNKKIIILAATSGDTGKAALEGFKNVENTEIITFYPVNGVSETQKLQMTTQEGNNTHVIGINGNFDDAQNQVKKAFTDNELIDYLYEKGYMFSSANSINIGRLLPQIVYYFYAYSQMVNDKIISLNDKVNFTVPTGNFGNILAGYYAKKMGLPIDKLICASNSNKVLYDFFSTGEYDKNRNFVTTMSPSMDILVSSNLERLLYHLCNDTEKVGNLMKQLNQTGKYIFDEAYDDFVAAYASEAETSAAVNDIFEKSGYVIDTHTAVACAAYKKVYSEISHIPNIILSTASPFKFAADIVKSLKPDLEQKDTDKSSFEYYTGILSNLSGVQLPKQIADLGAKPQIHNCVVEKDNVNETILRFVLSN